MISSQTSIRANRPEKELLSDGSNKAFKLSSRNVLEEPGNRFFISKNSPEPKKPSAAEKELLVKNKPEKSIAPIRDSKRRLSFAKLKEELQGHKRRNDRDFRRVKSKYNNGMANILREWVNLIYCILILRMNLIKFIVDKFPEFGQNDAHLQKQILLESKTIHKIISKAQHFSQEQFLYMWSHLDKLILNRMILKIASESVQIKGTELRDWKGASEKLNQCQGELEKAQSTYKDVQKKKNHFELAAKEKLSKLETLTTSKNAEIENLVQQIRELKNNEVQMRGKILLNMKGYVDLKNKKQNLLNIEKEMIHLKNSQNTLMQEYTAKIQSLKNQLEAKEKQIKLEIEEKKKIKASLSGFGDFSEKLNLSKLHEY